MTPRTIIHNGVEMAEGWPDQIREAQGQTTYVINGKKYPRIPYGQEGGEWGLTHGPATTVSS